MTLVEGTKEQRTVLEKSVLDDRGVYGERGRRGEAREEEGWEHRGEISGAKLIKKKKNPRSGWQPRTVFIFGFCSRLYKLAWSVPVGVYSLVQLESDSLVSWRLSPQWDPEALSLVAQRFAEYLLCVEHCSESGRCSSEGDTPAFAPFGFRAVKK